MDYKKVFAVVGIWAVIAYILIFLVVGWMGSTNAANACTGTYTVPGGNAQPKFITHYWQPNLLTLGTTGSCIVK